MLHFDVYFDKFAFFQFAIAFVSFFFSLVRIFEWTGKYFVGMF